MVSTFFRQMDACVIVYDITNYKSYKDIEYWYTEINNYNTNDNLLIYLVANKTDLKMDYDFTSDRAFSNINNMNFVKTTIFDNKTIKNLLNLIIRDLSTLPNNFIFINNIEINESKYKNKCINC